jgi:hypothetical protein
VGYNVCKLEPKSKSHQFPGFLDGLPTYVASSLKSLANLLKNQAKYGDAEPLYRRALAILEAVHGPDHPDVAFSLNELANLLEKKKYIKRSRTT